MNLEVSNGYMVFKAMKLGGISKEAERQDQIQGCPCGTLYEMDPAKEKEQPRKCCAMQTKWGERLISGRRELSSCVGCC